MPTLNWIGKQAVVKHHQEVPYRLLEPVPEFSLPVRPEASVGEKAPVRAEPVEARSLTVRAERSGPKGREVEAQSSAGTEVTDISGNLIVQGDNLLALKALTVLSLSKCVLRQA